MRADRGLLVAGATLLFAVASPGPAAAWCRLTTQSGAVIGAQACITQGVPLAWVRPCISYSLYKRGSRQFDVNELRAPIEASFDAWQEVDCGSAPIPFLLAPTDKDSLCDKAVFNSDGGNVNTVAFVDDWLSRDHDPTAYALTSVWHDQSGRIRDADMEINDSDKAYGTCATAASCNVVDIQNVVTHEAGHFLGLAHSDKADATMFASAPDREIEKRTLTDDDVAGLCAIYPPGSLAASCDFDPEGGFEATCSKDDGCSVRAPGRSQGPMGLALLAGFAALAVGRRYWRR